MEAREARKQLELRRIQENPEDVATVLEVMGDSLAWTVRKGLEHGEDFQRIILKFVSRNI